MRSVYPTVLDIRQRLLQPRRREIRETAQLERRHALCAGWTRWTGSGSVSKSAQHDLQPPFLDRIASLIGQDLRQIPTPASAASIAASAVLTASRDADRHRPHGPRFDANGQVAMRVAAEGDAGQGREIGGRFRRAVALRENPGCAQTTRRTSPTRAATMLLSCERPMRTARSIWSPIRSALRSDSASCTLISGNAARKALTDRQHMQTPEHDRRSDGEIAARSEIFARAARSASPTCSRILLRGREIGGARIGQRQLSRGADQETRVEMRFQLRHLAADGRQRHAEPAARGGEAAGLDRRHQDRHGFQPVHLYSRISRG